MVEAVRRLDLAGAAEHGARKYGIEMQRVVGPQFGRRFLDAVRRHPGAKRVCVAAQPPRRLEPPRQRSLRSRLERFEIANVERAVKAGLRNDRIHESIHGRIVLERVPNQEFPRRRPLQVAPQVLNHQ